MTCRELLIKEKRIAIVCIIYDFFIFMAGYFILGLGIRFAGGVVLGSTVMLMNFFILSLVVNAFFQSRGKILPAIVYLLRLILYAIFGIICFKISDSLLLGYALGIVGIVPGAIFCRNI